MNCRWEILLLEATEALDAREAPHGLYGLRHVYSTQGRLPTLAHLLSSPGKTNILRQCGFQGTQSRQGSHVLGFGVGGSRQVSLQVLDYASTKVRHYGSAYRLDSYHGKEPGGPKWDLETRLPKLPILSRGDRTSGILLCAHYASPRDLENCLGRSVSSAFLERYQLDHYVREWEDRYGRGFRTALHLWTARTTVAEPEVSPASLS